MMKSWRNKNPLDDKPDNAFDSVHKLRIDNENDANDMPQQPANLHQLPQLTNSIEMKDESFSMSVYILLILTLAVIIIFLNCYHNRRNTIRTRRKCFPFNKLGF